MPNFCSLVITGHLGQLPDLSYTAGETAVVSGSIAYNPPAPKDKPKNTVWLAYVAFNKTAEFIARYFQKGSAITFQGNIECDKWTDKNTGQERERLKIIVRDAAFAGEKNTASDDPSLAHVGNAGGEGSVRDALRNPPKPNVGANQTEEQDDLPF